MSEAKRSDAVIIGAMITGGCGMWLAAEWAIIGGTWKLALGAAFFLFAVIRIGLYWKSSKIRPKDGVSD